MQGVLRYIGAEWARSGNPDWLKVLMVIALLVIMIIWVRQFVGVIREYRAMIRRERAKRARLEPEFHRIVTEIQFESERSMLYGKKTSY